MIQWRILNVDGFEAGLEKHHYKQRLARELEQHVLWMNCFREAAKAGIEVRI